MCGHAGGLVIRAKSARKRVSGPQLILGWESSSRRSSVVPDRWQPTMKIGWVTGRCDPAGTMGAGSCLGSGIVSCRATHGGVGKILVVGAPGEQLEQQHDADGEEQPGTGRGDGLADQAGEAGCPLDLTNDDDRLGVGGAVLGLGPLHALLEYVE